MTKTAPAELSALQQKIRDDFPEWLSPIIVRELRQGLRTHAFVGGLILLHAVMATLFCLKLTNAAAEVDNVVLRTRTIQEWTHYGLLAVFMALQPLRALVSISDEQKASTLDLVQLTSLSSWKIVWGKWSALAGQTLLLAVSLLPYELLSYFMGGYDVVASSIQWLMLLGLSLGFTAFALALSSSGWFIRISMLGLPAFFAWVFMLELVMRRDSYIGGSSFPWYALSFHGLLATLFCLAVAAKRISAAVENSALWLRGIVLLQLLVSSAVGAWLLWKQDSNAGAWWFFAVPTVGWLCMEMLTETASPHVALYQPWLRRLRRWPRLRRLFYPGWWSGMRLLLTLTLVAVVAFYLGYHDTRYNPSGGLTTTWSPWNLYPMVLIHLVGLALSPALFFAFLPSLKRRHWLYLVSIGVMVVMGLLLQACIKPSWLWPDLAALNPWSGFMWCGDHSRKLWHATEPFAWDNLKGEALRHLQVSAVCYLTALTLLRWKGRAEVQQVKEAEAEAERLLLRGDAKETTV